MKRIPCYPAEKLKGIMLGLMIGDALGSRFNDMQPDDIPLLDLDYIRDNPPKRYTDDTEMAISVLEERICNGIIDQGALKDRFLRRYSSWRRYGGGMLEVIERWRRGDTVRTAAASLYDGTGNFGNGAAMRVAPISAFFTLDELDDLFEQVRRCAILTHTHSYGISGALLQSYAVLLALNDIPVDTWINRIFKLPIESAYKIKMGDVVQCLERNATANECAREVGNDAEAIEAVPAAVYSFLRHPDSFTDSVSFAVSMGGDTDTIAAMTGAISGAFLGDGEIPEELWTSLDERKEGPLFVRKLVEQGYCN
jgi:ADP-ribosylglycohydrolase